MNHRVNLLFLLGLLPFLLTYCAGSSRRETIPQSEPDTESASSPMQSTNPSLTGLSTLRQITHTYMNGISRVTFELDREARYTLLQARDKLVMDIFDAAVNPQHQIVPVRNELIRSLTVDQVSNSLVRAIFELEEEHLTYSPATAEQPFQITVDIKKLPGTILTNSSESADPKRLSLPKLPTNPPSTSLEPPSSISDKSSDKPPIPSVTKSQTPTAQSSSLPTSSESIKPQSFQSLPPASQSPLSNTGVPQEYRLGPGDVIKLSVLGEESLDKTYTISPDGLISLPLLGEVRAGGLTIPQLDDKITQLLAKDYLVDPQVTVEIVKTRSRKVNIIGAVRQPGSYELTGEGKVLNTLLSAGGPSSFDVELKILRLSQKGQEGKEGVEVIMPIVVDLQKLFVEGDSSQNIPLQDGDVLIVSEAQKKSRGTPSGEGASLGEKAKETGQIYVLGSVGKPGTYDYQEGDTVLDVILRAGGFTEYASKNGTKIVREVDGKTETLKIKMEDVVKKGAREKNPPVYPGDMVIVPESLF